MNNHGCPDTDPVTEELALLGHDLRSAITDVLAGLTLIDSDRLTKPDRQQLNRARATAASLGHYLEDALTTLLAQSTPVLEKSSTDLAQLLQDLTHRWCYSVGHNPNAVEIITAPLPPLVLCNRTALDRILSNLISNAITHSGGKTIHLSVTHPTPNQIRFVITDQGPGFPADIGAQPRKGSAQNSALPAWRIDAGHGLGLSIAQTLAQRMGATLDLRNQSSGAMATLTLPITKPSDDTQPPLADTSCLKGKNVLLADDSMPQLLLLEQYLRDCGAKTTLVRNGLAAEAALQKGGFELALLDLEMPGRSGLEICTGLRDHPPTTGHAACIVILTAHNLPAIHEQALAAGADKVLVKPIMSAAALTNALCELHDAHQATQQAVSPPADTSTFLRLLDMAGPDLATELLTRYQEDLATAQTQLQQALPALDWRNLQTASHVLIALAGTAGATALEHSARAFNTAAIDQDQNAIRTHKDSVLDGLAGLLTLISQIANERQRPQ